MRKLIPSLRNILSLLIPALYLGCVLAYDLKEPFRTVTPALCSIGLMLLAVFLRPGWVAMWGIVYSCIVTYVLLNDRMFSILSNGFNPPEMTSHKFRVAGFFATALFCFIFSYLLNRLRVKQQALNHLFLKMPLPIVISNQAGHITLMNDKARSFFELEGDMPLNPAPNYFDLLAPKKHQGKCISAYLNAFKEGTDKNNRINLEYLGNPLIAHIELLDSRAPQLITMLP